MSGLIAKANKRRSATPQKARPKAKKSATAKKAALRKPKRPGKITAKPKLRKAAAPKKKLVATKKSVAKSKKRPIKAAPKKTATKVAVAARPKVKARQRGRVLARERTMVVKPAPPQPKKPPSPGALAAVKAFEHALRLFNRHNFESAKAEFEALSEKFGEQAEVVARVRTYVTICEQKLSRTPTAPRNADALYDQGVFELNRGSTRDAIALFEKALKIEPRADHIFYSLAAAHARLNETTKAIEALRRATTIRPVHRSHARRDLDFVNLRSNEDFQQLTGFGFDLIEE